ncbi:MAG: bifunctional riboflavin kinase/FAD synthetase [Actinomycetes bacterium]
MRIEGALTPGCVVAIGIFDGVHAGHQEILREAKSLGKKVLALTFDPHPTTIFAPDKSPAMLTTLERRMELLRENGADAVAVIEFTKEFAALTPEAFVTKYLVENFAASAVVVGANFTYGHKAAGNVATLTQSGTAHGFAVKSVELQEIAGSVVSSTRIRSLLAAGDLDQANTLLTRVHRVTGCVVHGEKRGREIGYPTANLGSGAGITFDSAIPSDGVYAGWLTVGERRWPAAISIGTNPTFAGVRNRQVEAYALDQKDLDLYDQIAEIDFGWRLRETVKFDALEPLLVQMKLDSDQARSLTA